MWAIGCNKVLKTQLQSRAAGKAAAGTAPLAALLEAQYVFQLEPTPGSPGSQQQFSFNFTDWAAYLAASATLPLKTVAHSTAQSGGNLRRTLSLMLELQ
jgi:hypothetical protein